MIPKPPKGPTYAYLGVVVLVVVGLIALWFWD